MNSELKGLIRKRGAVITELNQFESFIDGIGNQPNDENITAINIGLNSIHEIVNTFRDIQSQIEAQVADEDVENEYAERRKFLERHTLLITRACTLIKKGTKPNEVPLTGPNGDLGSNVKLPTINLPKFSGDLGSWLEFKDMFQSLIDKSPSLDPIQKFHYLKASLQGDAMKALQSITVSSDNYAVAWNILCDRYDNNHLLVQNHIKSIFNIKKINNENAQDIQQILDNLQRNLRALRTLKEPVDQWDSMLLYLLNTKLDPITSRDWEKQKISNNFTKLDDLIDFLKSKINFLESVSQSFSKNQNFSKPKSSSFLVSSSIKCSFCSKKSHSINYCYEFKALSIRDRISNVKNLKLCANCLKSDHNTDQCQSRSCKRCDQRHHTLLHSQTEVAVNNFSCNKANMMLLSTVQLAILNDNGDSVKCRALLDSGSQSNFITESLVNKLKIKKSKTSISIVGISKTMSSINEKCVIKIASAITNYTYDLSCLVLPKITNYMPSQYFCINKWDIPGYVQLADPQFNCPSEVDVLIGAELFWALLKPQQVKLGFNGPTLQNTELGWVVSGPVTVSNDRHTTCNLVRSVNNWDDISKFWEIEEVESPKFLDNDDQQCEEHFAKNTTRGTDGRFVVRLPLKFKESNLGNSQILATKMLNNLFKKFTRDSSYKTLYASFMDEYKNLGHMSEVKNFDISKFKYFLPHHGVLRENSLTTKLRVVFNGSARTNTGWSLNDLQYTGPAIQAEIFDILLRFRQRPFVVTADIEKMYRQIVVHPDDRHLQCILWSEAADKPLQVFELNTVTYGTRSAPYLAIRCLKQLGMEHQLNHPKAAKTILNDFYVDDLIASFDDKDEAIQVCKAIRDILALAQFPLRKWASNDQDIYCNLYDSTDPIGTIKLGDTIKALGVLWCPSTDILRCDVPNLKSQSNPTKRSILSDVAKIFDPLGLLSPCIVTAKILIQNLWLCKLDWDDNVPNCIEEQWVTFHENLPRLKDIIIRRHITCLYPVKTEIHGFCDASQKAYGACVYVRSIDSSNRVYTNLLCAKTKVAPVKFVTIPRLELSSALLLAKLMTKIITATNMSVNYYLWSDSKIVLSWLRAHPSKLQTFVANRVNQIQTLTDVNSWRYVRSKQNPADLCSRGVCPSVLHNSDLWWQGSQWLSDATINFDNYGIFDEVVSELPEFKVQKVTLAVTTQDSIFQKYSSFNKLQRVMAYVLRFFNNSRVKRENRVIGNLRLEELNNSKFKLIQMAQAAMYKNEIELLKNNKDIKHKHKLVPLAPFVDNTGILRVGGRLQNSHLNYDAKHQILLCGKHIFTQMIFEAEHRRLLHAGPQLLLSTIRQQYWPTSGMNVAKKVVRRCVTCFRCKPKQMYPMMAKLPATRVTVQNVFYNTGVDYAGPIQLRDRKGRGSKLIKGYICIFICFSVKAVHLELVTELSSDSFLAALRRFVSRRGKPANMYSDNGTNFIGASKQLRQFFELSKDHLMQQCNDSNINWHFIPPGSPHFGGLWESSVKSVKHHLRRSIGEAKLTYEEFLTMLVQIESILNSRPLCPLSSDPNDLQPLTPAHFLVGKPLTALPDPDLTGIKINRLNRFQLLQQIQQSFWNRWSKEYLSQLQRRVKWHSKPPNIKVDQLVLIKEDNLPPQQLLLGRVTECHPGSDDITRVVTIRTANRSLKRSVTKICPLPIETDDSENPPLSTDNAPKVQCSDKV